MTRKALLELIQGRCKKLDETGQFGLQYIQGYCDQVWQEFVREMFVEKDTDLSHYSKDITGLGLSVSGDEYTMDLYPNEMINLPRVGSGVSMVKAVISGVTRYLDPVTEDDYNHMRTQAVYRQGDDIFFYVGYNRIYFGGDTATLLTATTIKPRLVIPFSSYGLTELLPLPSIKEVLFVDTVVSRVAGTPPVDQTNKNSDS